MRHQDLHEDPIGRGKPNKQSYISWFMVGVELSGIWPRRIRKHASNKLMHVNIALFHRANVKEIRFHPEGIFFTCIES